VLSFLVWACSATIGSSSPFVSTTTIFCIYVFALSALYFKVVMSDQSLTVWQTMGKTVVAVILMAYTFIMVWFVGGLTAFHIYLMSSNQVGTNLSLSECIP